jgi:glycerophosphoryl diester phosphodiesterase
LPAISRAADPSDRLPEALRPRPGRIRTIAHRGDSASAPENTIEAFEAAVAAGSDLIEIDVRRTADGDAAVIHDESALRTTGIDAPVAELPAAVLGAADAGSWFAPAFAGARVPMLGEVAAWGATHPEVGWLVELKGRWTAAQLAGPVAAIRRHDISRALLVLGQKDVSGLLQRLEVLGAAGCNPIGRLPNEVPGLASRLRGAGYSVYPWTLDEPDEWGAAGGAGVDGVITNRPGAFRSWHALRWSPDAPVVAS